MHKTRAPWGQQAWVRSHRSGCKAFLHICNIMPVRHWPSHLSLHLLLSRCDAGLMSRMALSTQECLTTLIQPPTSPQKEPTAGTYSCTPHHHPSTCCSACFVVPSMSTKLSLHVLNGNQA